MLFIHSRRKIKKFGKFLSGSGSFHTKKFFDNYTEDIMKKLTTSFIFILLFTGCKIEIPVGVFDHLKNEEVLKPLEYLDEGVRENASLPMSLNIPAETKEQIASYKWEIENYFGNLKFSATGEAPVVEGLTAEEYTVFVTISSKDKENPASRIFEKTFIVWKPEELSDLALLGLVPECDSGLYNNDGFTTINTGLKFNARVSDEFLNKKLKLSWISKEDSPDSGSVEVSPTTANEFVIEVGSGVTFREATYEFYLEDPADSEKIGNKTTVVIDRTAPTLTWKISDEEIQTVWNYGEGDEALSSYLVTTASEPVYNITFKSNIPGFEEMAQKVFLSNCVGTQQVIDYQGSDLAGNMSNALSRSVTVKAPVSPKAVEDPSFENGGTGLNSDSAWSDTNGKLSSAWTASVKSYMTKLGWTGSTSGVGQGPFRHSDSNFADYAYAGVKTGEAKSGNNAFWFCGTFNAGGIIQCWYSNSSGYLYQQGFNLKKKVSYKASVWVKSNQNGISADKNVKICFAVPVFNDDGSVNGEKTEILASAYTTDAAFSAYEQVSVEYTPTENQTVAILICKDDRGESDDNWVLLDDVSLEETYLTVTDDLR